MLRICSEPYRRLADEQKLALDRCNRLWVFRNASKSMPRTNCTIISMLSRISRRESVGSLKGKDGLVQGFGCNWLLQPFCRRKIHADAQHVSEAVFDSDHIQKRQTASGSELGYDIDIRQLADGRSARVGAVQEQMLDASGSQFALMFPQFGYDCGLVHVATLLHILPHRVLDAQS